MRNALSEIAVVVIVLALAGAYFALVKLDQWQTRRRIEKRVGARLDWPGWNG